MTSVLIAALCFAPVAPIAAAQIDAADAASVTLSVPSRPLWVGELVELNVVLDLDVAFFETWSVPLVQRELDLQVLLGAPWFEGIEGLLVPLDGELGGSGPSLALGGSVVRADRSQDREVDGRLRRSVTVARHFRAEGAGAVDLTGPILRFAYATEFGESFLGGRQPLDHFEAFAQAQAATLAVRDLPEQGRPPSFIGVLGDLTVQAGASPRDLTLGEKLELRLTLGGADLGGFTSPPHLPSSAGLRASDGTLTRGATQVEVVYTIEPLREGALDLAVPQVSSFDPVAGVYRTVALDPIPIVVRAAPASGTALDLESGADEPASTAAGSGDDSDTVRNPGLLGGIAALALAIAAAGLWALRRRGARAMAPTEVQVRAQRTRERARAARGELDRALQLTEGHADRDESASAMVGSALIEFLARALDCSVAAVVGPDLDLRLRSAGVAAATSGRLAALVDELVAARFGGVARDEAAELARILVDEAF
ncbi:BatD family protein [Engelhardtia mirabilis]|uniref:BatD family protein n=1 Tax=Engelhardtia mirabilis TaxID=2528011 RepID=UPI0011A9D4E8